jgi:hypothetical protein
VFLSSYPISFINNLEKIEFHGVVGSCHVNADFFIHVDNTLMPKASYHA